MTPAIDDWSRGTGGVYLPTDASDSEISKFLGCFNVIPLETYRGRFILRVGIGTDDIGRLPDDPMGAFREWRRMVESAGGCEEDGPCVRIRIPDYSDDDDTAQPAAGEGGAVRTYAVYSFSMGRDARLVNCPDLGVTAPVPLGTNPMDAARTAILRTRLDLGFSRPGDFYVNLRHI